jgi:class 3 adenylate cyclase
VQRFGGFVAKYMGDGVLMRLADAEERLPIVR